MRQGLVRPTPPISPHIVDPAAGSSENLFVLLCSAWRQKKACCAMSSRPTGILPNHFEGVQARAWRCTRCHVIRPMSSPGSFGRIDLIWANKIIFKKDVFFLPNFKTTPANSFSLFSIQASFERRKEGLGWQCNNKPRCRKRQGLGWEIWPGFPQLRPS